MFSKGYNSGRACSGDVNRMCVLEAVIGAVYTEPYQSVKACVLVHTLPYGTVIFKIF